MPTVHAEAAFEGRPVARGCLSFQGGHPGPPANCAMCAQNIAAIQAINISRFMASMMELQYWSTGFSWSEKQQTQMKQQQRTEILSSTPRACCQ